MSGRHGQCLSCVDRICHPFAHQQQQQHPHCAHSLLLPVGGLLLRRRHLPCRLALGRLWRCLERCQTPRFTFQNRVQGGHGVPPFRLPPAHVGIGSKDVGSQQMRGGGFFLACAAVQVGRVLLPPRPYTFRAPWLLFEHQRSTCLFLGSPDLFDRWAPSPRQIVNQLQTRPLPGCSHL